MTHDEYLALQALAAQPHVVRGQALSNQDSRTLVYGYSCDRSTFHLYLEQGVLTRVLYDHDGLCLSVLKESADEGLPIADCVPDKRMYPERCDHEFVQLLQRLGKGLLLTSWPEQVPAPAPFYGKKLEELCQWPPASLCFDIPDFMKVLAEQTDGVSAEALKALTEQIQAWPYAALASLMVAAESCVREQLFRAEAHGRRDATLWLTNALVYLPELLQSEGRGAPANEDQLQIVRSALTQMTARRVASLRQLQAQEKELAHAA